MARLIYVTLLASLTHFATNILFIYLFLPVTVIILSYVLARVPALTFHGRLPGVCLHALALISMALHINGRSCADAFHGKPDEAARLLRFSAMQMNAGVLRRPRESLPPLSP